MKKAKYLVLSTALATMLMGAGYAAWTDDFTVKNTVETGELEVALVANTIQERYDADFTNTSWDLNPELKDNVDMDEATQDPAQDLHMNEWKPVSVDEDTQTVSFSFFNMYPGTTMETELVAVNEGTLPAVINDLVIDEKYYTVEDGAATETSDSEIKDAILVDYNFIIGDPDDATPRATITGNNVSLANLASELQTKLEGVYLLPGEEFRTYDDRRNPDEAGYALTFKIPKESLNGDEGENEKMTFDLQFNFAQHNAATVDKK